MGEKKKFSYNSDTGDSGDKSAAKKTPGAPPARHRQDLNDIARQTGIGRAEAEPVKQPAAKAAAPAQEGDPFQSSSREETVRRLREQRVQRSGGETVRQAAGAGAKTAPTANKESAAKPAATQSASAGEGLEARSRKKEAAAQSAAKTAPGARDSASNKKAVPAAGEAKKVYKSAESAQESGVSDRQLELVKKMDSQKAARASSDWKGQPASGGSKRVSDAASRAGFSSLAPSNESYTGAPGAQVGEFEEAEEDFAAERRTSGKKSAAPKSAKAEAAEKRAAAKSAKKSAKNSARNDKKAASESSGKPKKKSKALAIALCSLGALLLLAGGAAALYFTGAVDFFPSAPNTYEAADYDTFMKYLTHPSLKAGDTINTSGQISVDVDAEFGGFVSLPLVNLNGVSFENGILLLLGGAKQSSASLDGVSFNNCEVYLDAPHTALTWSSALSDKYINCATLNGSAHLTGESFPIVGAKMKIPVTLQNSGAALTNAEITFSSPSYIFTEGETYIVDSIPANSTVAVEVPVIAVEGGRTRIYAHDATGAVSGDSGFVDIVGTGYVSGDIHTHSTAGIYKRYSTIAENVESGYQNGMSYIVSVENFFSQDEENQANEAVWAEEAAKRKKEEEAAKAAEEERKKAEEAANAASGGTSTDTTTTTDTTTAEGTSTNPRSLPVLTASAPLETVALTSTTSSSSNDDDDEEEEDTIRTEALDPEYPEKLEQSTVDEIVGGSGRFLQLTGNETGQNNQHMLILKANVVPRSDYQRQIPKYGLWTYQAAVDKVVDKGGIVVLPHFFDRDITVGANMIKSLYNVTALEMMSGGRGSESLETRAEFQAWDAINAEGLRRIFAVMSSNNSAKEEVGTRYTSGRMGRLTESNIYTMLESGNYIATNGPTVRFELGGAEMGGMTFVSASGGAKTAEAGESGEGGEGGESGEPAAAVTTRTQAKIYACDDSPLTSVKLIRYEMKSAIENPDPDYVLDIDLTGQGVYEYSAVVDVDARPGEFYRFEARSELDDAGDDVGVGLSNPIWIYDAGNAPSSVVSASGFGYKFGGEVVKSANNIWCVKAKNFLSELFSADTTAAYTSTTHHERDSEKFPDTVTVYMLAPDGKTSSTETLYILN